MNKNPQPETVSNFLRPYSNMKLIMVCFLKIRRLKVMSGT